MDGRFITDDIGASLRYEDLAFGRLVFKQKIKTYYRADKKGYWGFVRKDQLAHTTVSYTLSAYFKDGKVKLKFLHPSYTYNTNVLEATGYEEVTALLENNFPISDAPIDEMDNRLQRGIAVGTTIQLLARNFKNYLDSMNTDYGF